MRTKSKKLTVTLENLLGPSRDLSLNCEELNYPNFNLVDLDVDITGEEVKRVILDMPKENAPGPDGFIGAFYSTCWATVQGDVVQAIRQLAQLRGKNFNHFNTGHIVLLPKREKAECIRDYRPITLVHSIAKIFSKIMASRLAHHLAEMVSSSQSDFVKKKDASTIILS
jgi:hypothetical protein